MHKNADLDALGSACYISEVYGDSVIISECLDRHSKNATKTLGVKIKDSIEFPYDEVIVVDTANRQQLGKFRDLHIDVVYDHHESNNIDAVWRYVNPSYPSCSELVYDIHKKAPSRNCALLLLAGIVSDTDWFRHGNRRTIQIVSELMNQFNIEIRELRSLVDLPVNFGEKIALLKGFQRLVYRSVGDRIVIATRVSAHESLVATQLLNYSDVVFVGSSRKNEVRIIGRSANVNLLEIFALVSRDFSCTYGGHPQAAGMSCKGDLEAVLNASLDVAMDMLKEHF